MKTSKTYWRLRVGRISFVRQVTYKFLFGCTSITTGTNYVTHEFYSGHYTIQDAYVIK